ncbi:hypothetical protein V8F20_008306 [Naviculisporaceae sp. PSN 640]
MRWTKKKVRQARHPEIDVWMADTTTDPDRSTRVYVREGSKDLRSIKYHYRQYLRGLNLRSRSTGFVKARALRQVAMYIQTCGSAEGDGPYRPEFVYRAVHDGQPHGGIKARGYGIAGREPDPFYFQIFLQHHLAWRSRQLSPFMSVTNSLEKAVRICAYYYARGMSGIRILKIRTSGPGWKHWDMKMWDVEDLVAKFRLTKHWYFENEWVIENEIPASAVLKTTTLDDIVRMGDMEGAKKEYILGKKLYDRIKDQLSKEGKKKRLREKELDEILYGKPSLKRATGFNALSVRNSTRH